MRSSHRLRWTDRQRRTAWCTTCGPTTVRRGHLTGRWHCAQAELEGRARRRARRERETLELAQALMRSPRPPI